MASRERRAAKAQLCLRQAWHSTHKRSRDNHKVADFHLRTSLGRESGSCGVPRTSAMRTTALKGDQPWKKQLPRNRSTIQLRAYRGSTASQACTVTSCVEPVLGGDEWRRYESTDVRIARCAGLSPQETVPRLATGVADSGFHADRLPSSCPSEPGPILPPPAHTSQAPAPCTSDATSVDDACACSMFESPWRSSSRDTHACGAARGRIAGERYRRPNPGMR